MNKAHPPSRPSALFISTSGLVGGMERNVCALARYFDRHGWKTTTTFPEIGAADELHRWCEAQGVVSTTTSAVLPVTARHTWPGVLALRRLIRSVNPDFVSIHYGSNNVSLKDVIALRLSGRRKCIVTVYHPTEWTDSLQSRKKQLLTRLSAALLNEITTISQATADVLHAAGIPNSLHVIPCGLPTPNNDMSRVESRVHFGWTDDMFVIGCVARLEDTKGIDTLIEAVELAGHPSWHLAIVGRGPQQERLQSMIDERLPGRATLIGYVPKVDDFLVGCDVFALPSRLEGFGLVFVEAAFHGIPSVATNVGGIPEVIIDGETGLLVPVDDVAALATALEQLTEESRRTELGRAARSRAYEQFTEDVMGRRFDELVSATPSDVSTFGEPLPAS